MVVDHRLGALPIPRFELRQVMPDRQELDTLASGGGRQFGQVGDGGNAP
jgi:hypothetical protein